LYYASNLLGSGAGAICGLLMLYRWHPLDIPSLLGLAIAVLLIIYTYTLIAQTESISAKISWQLISMGSLVLILVVGWLIPLRPEMSPYKGLSRARLMPDTEVAAEKTTPLGVLTVLRGPTLRSVTGLSLSYQGTIPTQATLYQDGNTLGAAPSVGDIAGSRSLRHTSYVLPYRVGRFDTLNNGPKVLVLSAGAGAEVQQALVEGCRDVTAVVRNEGLVQVLDESFEAQKGDHSVYHDHRVHLELAEPRNFLYRDRDPFDIIIMPPVGGVMSASAAMASVYEDHLLTVEGVVGMLRRLTPEGMLCFTTWLDHPPRRPLKLFGLLAAALEAWSPEPMAFPGAHLVAISSWNVVTMVLSRTPWTAVELERMRQFAHSEGFDLLHDPGREDAFPGADISGECGEPRATLIELLSDTTDGQPAVLPSFPDHEGAAHDAQYLRDGGIDAFGMGFCPAVRHISHADRRRRGPDPAPAMDIRARERSWERPGSPHLTIEISALFRSHRMRIHAGGNRTCSCLPG
jgi:hypothetical protein